jgi:hypothetical protein
VVAGGCTCNAAHLKIVSVGSAPTQRKVQSGETDDSCVSGVSGVVLMVVCVAIQS